jgi:hypothetical protein
METKFERRLREVLTEYPDIDPEKASQVLRAQPGVSNYYIAILSGVNFEEAEKKWRLNMPKEKKEEFQLKYSQQPSQEGVDYCLRLLQQRKERLQAQKERAALKDKDLH